MHFGSKDRFVFQRGAANSKHAAWSIAIPIWIVYFFVFESWVFTHIINLLKVELLESGSCQSSKAAWIFTNNLPNCSGRISYPVAVPDAPRGMYWRDALFNEPFEIFEGSIMAGTKPLVLVLEPTHATS